MITVTKWVIVAVTAALIVYDIVVAATPPGGDTLSEVIRDFARNWFFIPLTAGVLMGHWFWNTRKVSMGVWRYWVLGAIGCVALVIDFIAPIRMFPIVPFLLGIPLGHFLWPQQSE